MSPRATHLLACLLPALSTFAQDSARDEQFEKKVRPVLVAKCQACHNEKVKTAGLDLSTAQGFAHGGQSGAIVSRDEPESSLLLKVIAYEDRLKMPPTGKLATSEISAIREWVESGARWPGAPAVAGAGPRGSQRAFTEAQKNWWAFQPVTQVAPPAVNAEGRAASPVDRFLHAALAAKNLKPAPEADKFTLLRRVTFDLTGLPPTEEEIAAFVADGSPDAWANVVDRLIASPRYGERWGRHWLDLARYADSTGNDEDHRYPYAWRYRDYVIDAFNSDLPYDRFIREQIAGDLLPPPEPGKVNRRGIVATGFLALGAKAIAQQDKTKMLYDVYDEQVDVLSKTFLGLTVACARCHDHKFDPILTKDYYAMVAFFANTRSFDDPEPHVSKLLFKPLVSDEEMAPHRDHQKRVDALNTRIDILIETEKQRINESHASRLAAYMLAARVVYTGGGADAAETARARGLDEALLKRWANYLKPRPGIVRPHLDDWDHAAPEEIENVAAAYQSRYAARLPEWTSQLAEWRGTAQAALDSGDAAPPKPSFDAEIDGFFFDVHVDAAGPFSLNARDQQRLAAGARETLQRLRGEQSELRKSAPPEPDMACAVEDLREPVTQHVFIRGDYASRGEEVDKGYVTILARAGDPVPNGAGSGRTALADWIANKANPLTARVMANRVWQWHFGEGLVRTPDNFGRMGEAPTHPELLDWLAAEFVRANWSVKSLHRTILMSSAYRMSSAASAETLAADPENRLWSRFQRRRLDVEEIRDALLAVDGSLDFTMGGTLQSGSGTDGENSANRLSVRPEDYARRTVYLPLRRANLPALLNLFDFGDATTTQGKRVRTNIAPQALFMLNSEFLTTRTRNLAGQTIAESATSPARRVEKLYLRTLNRPPSADEVDSSLSYAAAFRQKFDAPELEAWQSLARALLASNDFIYVD